MIPRDADTAARLERLIDQYRQQKHRQRLLRAIKLWRRTGADQGLASFELLPERVH